MNLHDDILNKIQSGELKMHSRWYFVWQAILVIMATVILFLVSVFFVSFVFYILRTSDIALLPGFGSHGFAVFLLIFPWLPVIVAFILTILLSFLLKRYSFAYRNPLLYLPVLIIAVIVAVSVIVHLTSFHDRLAAYSMQRGVPVVDTLYRNFSHPEQNRIIDGKIIAISGNSWQIESRNNRRIGIKLSSQTKLASGLMTGDEVVVFGQRQGPEFEATEIKKQSFWDRFSFFRIFMPCLGSSCQVPSRYKVTQ